MVFRWWRLMASALVAIVVHFHGFCYSEQAPNYTFVHQATSAPRNSYYDYIIIGGGTAGCPLAATLSQNSTVLLLERGDTPYGNQNISNLASFADTLADLSPTSASQRFISEDGVINARARVLGGGTCLNAGFYTRASEDEICINGWNGKLVNESYEWVEKAIVYEPELQQWQSAVRDGLLEAGVTPYNGFTYDHIYGTKIGGSIFDQDGHRHTAADLLEYANPNGIMVLLRATVHKILFRTKGKQRPIGHGVIFIDAVGTKHKAYLKKGRENEIILCAGTIASPQLLMLSGVGPAEHLRSHGIEVVVDQPMVGRGMSDNPMNAIFIPSPLPVEKSLVQVVGITRFGSYIEEASGVNFLSFLSQGTDLGIVTPQIYKQRSLEEMKGLEDEDLRVGTILEKVKGPLSTGHLELKNRNPDDNPSVTFNYFKEPEDLQTCVHGLNVIKKVIHSKAFSKFKDPSQSFESLVNSTMTFPLNLVPKHDNSSWSIEQFCKDYVITIWHYHGGCQVGRVVDHDYKVLGVDSLRVVDSSTFNFSPGTNPQATVMMLGRYMGIKILNERLKIDGME